MPTSEPSDAALVTRRRWLGQLASALPMASVVVSLVMPGLGCSSKSSSPHTGAKDEPAAAVTPLRFSGIPDSDKAALREQYAQVATYLEQALGRPVEYVHVPDYTAAVTALASKQVDFAWLGGVTAVQVKQQSGDRVEFVASRAKDLKFRSYFIANKDFAAAQKLQSLGKAQREDDKGNLAQLAPVLRKARMSFGAKASTSGHIMPRYFLGQPPLSAIPEKAFAAPVAYQLQGGHQATLRAVSSGAVDLGAINYATWEAASKALQDSAPVVGVTPTYVDYAIVAHKDLGADTLQKLTKALVNLSESNPKHQPVLKAFSAKSFVDVHAKQWAQIESVLAALTQKLG